MIIGAIAFQEGVEAFDRWAQYVLDATVDKNYTIMLNGTDNNGDDINPLFVAIDNYNNDASLDYAIDNITGSLAPYTSQTFAISPFAQRLMLNLTKGLTRIWISERNPPITQGTKYFGGTGTGPQWKLLFSTSGAIIVPDNWNNANNQIHCVGAGADGANAGGSAGNGGGSGAYSIVNNVSLTPGAALTYHVGLNADGSATSVTNSSATVICKANSATGRPGGNITGAVGDNKYFGGAGALTDGISGGGGGAVGVDANGIIGGGNPSGGAGGAADNPGVDGTTWTDSFNAAIGGYGGGAGGRTIAGAGMAAGKYGAGGGGAKGGANVGGQGSDGIILLYWTP